MLLSSATTSLPLQNEERTEVNTRQRSLYYTTIADLEAILACHSYYQGSCPIRELSEQFGRLDLQSFATRGRQRGRLFSFFVSCRSQAEDNTRSLKTLAAG